MRQRGGDFAFGGSGVYDESAVGVGWVVDRGWRSGGDMGWWSCGCGTEWWMKGSGVTSVLVDVRRKLLSCDCSGG